MSRKHLVLFVLFVSFVVFVLHVVILISVIVPKFIERCGLTRG